MTRPWARLLAGLSASARGLLAAIVVAGLPLAAAAQGPGTDFDHLTTGFPLTGAHKSAKCETCHDKGIFKGTPKTCEACHAPGARLSSVIEPTTHAPTTQRCDLCHTTVTFTGARWNHTGAQPGACATCHNGTTAPGKSSGHLQTTQSCDVCHRTSVWTPAAYDHTGIVAGCATCHNGSTALGKSRTHIPTTASCESCHTSTTVFATWTMSHAGIVNGCATCHGGQFGDVVAKLGTHIPTSAACETCHTSTTSFKGAVFDHAGIVNGCAACHNSATATGKPSTHIPTTMPCETCHTSTTAFSAWTMSHAQIASGCAQCHGGQFPDVMAKPANHVQTTASCETCHTNFTTFKGATFNHAGITGQCANCHNGNTALGMPANHVPTNQPCEVCHSASNFTTFAGTSMSHTGIVANCAACHASGASFFGVTMKTPPANHIPFAGAACETCHAPANFASFGATPMNHAAVTGTACTTCHETGKSFFGVSIVTRPTPAQDPNHPTTGDCGTCHTTSTFNGAVGKPANHLPTNQPCALCHSNPSDYSIGSMNHAGITSGCATCHAPGASFANIVPKTPPPTHFPTPMPCETCHAAANFASFAGTSMNHAGITNNCANCHAAGKSFFGVTMKTPPANHIPFAGAACETCHAPANFASFGATPMNHAAVTGTACTTCHETGKSFFGVSIVTRPTPAQDPNHPTTGDCGTCHTTSTFNGAVGKPANHLPTNQPCALCHSNPSDYSIGTMNHAGITSGCATCHAPGASFANIVPKTPPPTHFPTPMPCETCHAAANFASFAGTSMNHAGITNNCANCHAAGKSFFGVTMKTPPANHIPFAGAACETCHTPANFASFGATPMNHAAVTGMACTTCHETGKSFFGVSIVTRPTPAQDPNHPTTGDCGTCHTTSTFNGAVGKPANHLPTNQPCALCHSNPNDYSIGTMNHAGITSGCATCHAAGSSFANVMPKAPPANHIPFAGAACETCHAPANFASFGATPMNHAAVAGMACTTCHETGKSFFGVSIVTRPTPAQDPNHPTTGDCGTCHTTSTFNGAVGKPANHLPTNQPCALCHSNPSDYSIGTMNHSGITSGCAACHAAGSSFANVVPKAPPANHIPTSKPCETCHVASNFASFAGTAMNHAGITSGCANCHAAGKSFFGVTMKTPPVNHIPFAGAACETCHAAANFASFAGTPMNHAAVSGMKCMSCHEFGMSWFGVNIVTRPSASHFAGQDCSNCHSTSSFDSGDALLKRKQAGSGTTAAVTAPGQTPRGARPADAHLGIAPGSCATCHNGSAARSKPARHLVTTLSCDACHRTTTWSPASFTHATTAPGTCMSCHNAVLAKGRAASHFVTVRSCDACHRTTSWASVRYQHVSPAYRQHGPGVACIACHKTNAEAVVWTGPAFKPDCAGCHADRFRPQQHPKPGLGGGLHTLVELRDCAGSCHLGSGPAKAPKTFVSRHRPADGSF